MSSPPACAPSAQVRYEEALEEAPAAEAHAVHAERLIEVMRGLDRLVGGRLPQALDLEWERARRTNELAIVASEIAASAREIPVITGVGDEARAAFIAHARALENQANALADSAALLTRAELDARITSLRSVCDACHGRFGGGP